MANPAYRATLPIHEPRRPMDVRDAEMPGPAGRMRPPKGAPNVLMILIDGKGYGASSPSGNPGGMPVAGIHHDGLVGVASTAGRPGRCG
ncbi:hypothetical protein [Streptomyces sp. NPDC058964]|uniref:hypothetical protein n=1 Tax=Streptomyces sp. NPDC058964 TaxID=3346681 RepID=UPI0036A172D6